MKRVSATVFAGLEVEETRLGEAGIDGDVGDLRRQMGLEENCWYMPHISVARRSLSGKEPALAR